MIIHTLTLILSPLGPAFILALGGLAAMFARRLAYRAFLRPSTYGLRLSSFVAAEPFVARFRLPFAVLVLAAATGVLFLLRLPAADTVIGWDWQPLTVAGSTLEWRLDAWSWLICSLILMLTGIALLIAPSELLQTLERVRAETPHSPRLDQQGIEWERTFWLAAASLTFVCSSNVLTLATSWVLLDAALGFRLRPSRSPLLAGRAWGLLSLASLLLVFTLTVLGESGIRTALTDPGIDRFTLALLWLLALIRAGVYPLHFWLTGLGRVERSDAVAVSLIAPLAGVWLLVRLHGSAGPDWLRRPEWAALGALALLGTALVAWAAEDEARRWRWIALNRVSVVVMAAYTVGGSGPGALIWTAMAFVLGCALMMIARALQEQGWRAPAWLAALALWGLPGTIGFWARTTLVFPTELPGAAPLFGIVLLAEILLAAALWQAAAHRVERPPASRRVWLLGLIFVLLLAATVAGGLAPRLLVGMVSLPTVDSLAGLDTALAGVRRSVWIGLIGSGVAGVFLGFLRGRIFGQMRGWQSGIAAVASLEWLYQAVAYVFGAAASGLRYFATLGEGEGYLGWLALASLILWVLLRG